MMSMRMRFAGVHFAAAMLLMGAGCEGRNEGPPGMTEVKTPAVPTPADTLTAPSPADLRGTWTVVRHHIPGISAMTNAEANTWHGNTLRLTTTEAIFGDRRCDKPTYNTRTVESSFLATEYKLPPGSLKPLVSQERLTLFEVSCGGTPWMAMGVRLIAIDANHALAPWDGVFFELQRDRDFHAAGQEPFWRLEIAKGKEIRFTRVGSADVVTPVPKSTTDPQTGARIYHAITEANDLRVAIAPTACTDVMSGKSFEATVTITLNGQTYSGCGGEAPATQ